MGFFLFLKEALLFYFKTGTSGMSYNQLLFFVFLAIFLFVYFILGKSPLKKYWILIGNLFFWLWSGVGGIVIAVFTSVVTYIASRCIEKVYIGYEKDREGKELKPKEEVQFLASYKKKAAVYLYIAMAAIIGIWVFVKAGKFIGLPSVPSFTEMVRTKGIIVPLGISYYTLSAVGYLLDLYWRKAKPVHNYFNLLIVMTYFPHIIQGPISKYSKLLPQFDNIPKFDYNRLCRGLQLMLWGLVKKMIVADRLIIYTGEVFGNLDKHAGAEVFLAVILSGIQLYADFGGCMDIVMGISSAMGIELDRNFNQPFFSRTSSEFWTRWHMTLNAWTKEYIFLPIAMNPKFMKMVRTAKKKHGERLSSFLNSFVPLVTVWIFTGLWHGTGVDYLLWGLYWCLLMTISKETQAIRDKVTSKLRFDQAKWYRCFVQICCTYAMFVVGKCFTAANGLPGFIKIFQRMFADINIMGFFNGKAYKSGLDFPDFVVAFIFVLIMLAVDIAHEKKVNIREKIAGWILPARWFVYITAVILIVVFGMYGDEFVASDFIYAGF